MESKGRGVLDRPVEPGDDSGAKVARVIAYPSREPASTSLEDAIDHRLRQTNSPDMA
jgi:hypothetical protein